MGIFARIRTVLVGPVALVAAGLAAAAVPTNEAQATHTSILVVNNNVENLLMHNEACAGDWDELIAYLDSMGFRPDIFLLQQMDYDGDDSGDDNSQNIDDYVQRLEAEFGHDYRAIASRGTGKKNPNACDGEKRVQRNVVVFNDDRFDLLGRNRWQAQAVNSAGGCSNNDQLRTKSIEAMLYDNVTGKNVAAASVHWPTKTAGGRPCTVSNGREARNEMREAVNGHYADVKIIGGDFNVWQTYGSWDCELDCYEYNEPASSGWTVKYKNGDKRRIDFIFADTVFAYEATVRYVDAHAAESPNDDPSSCVTRKFNGCHYSEHRAVIARVNT